MTLSRFDGYCLDLQGYSALSDDTKLRINLAQRFKPAVCALVVWAGLVTGAWQLTLAASVLVLWASVLPGHPADLIHRLLQHVGLPALPADPRPRRFAFGMNGTMMLAATTALYLGHPVLGRALAGMAAVGITAMVLSGFCMGAFFYWLLVRRTFFRGVVGEPSQQANRE